MREIKFRGMTKKGHMVTGDLSMNCEFYYVISQPFEFSPTMNDPCGGADMEYSIVKSDTVGQFTGLFDKNGVDIYEGDLLRIPSESKFEDKTYNCFEVFYHDNECIGGQNIGFCMNRMHTQGSSGGGRGYKFTPESISNHGFIVIGNIHENPELLCIKK